MKKWLIVLCLMVLGGSVMSQNVIGKPKYYTDSTQYTPGHGTGYDNHATSFGVHKTMLNHPFNVVFLESTSMIGSDVAFGVNLSVVPSGWGVYGSTLWGVYDNWYKVGGIWRISRPNDWVDWQLYGGFVYGPYSGLGGELGLRFAVDNLFGNYRFSWWSMTMGAAIVSGSAFLTFGLSIGLSGLSIPAFILL